MKARKRIFDIRKHSRTTFSNENLWFFSEENSDNQAIPAQKKSGRNEGFDAIENYYSRYSFEEPEKEKSKKESPFIVDWQMSDSF
ncbi:MAG TPA: hypothetical protein VI413_04645 [Paludibacter sp.]